MWAALPFFLEPNMTRTSFSLSLAALSLVVGLSAGTARSAPICYPGSVVKDGSSIVGCFFEDRPVYASTTSVCGGTTRFDAWNDGTCSICLTDPYDDLITSEDLCELGDLRCLGCVNPPSDLAGWWSFDSEYIPYDADDDWSDNDNYANLYSGTTASASTTCGEVSQALVLDGVDDYGEMPDADSLDVGTADFTVMAWVKPSSVSGVRVILDKRTVSGSTYKGYSFFLTSGTLGLQLATGTGTPTYNNYALTAATITADGLWHHVAITVDRDSTTGMKFYLDGVYKGAGNPTGRTATLSNTAAMRLGKRSAGTSGGFFSGQIDEVQLYKRALSSAEILDIVDAGVYGTCYGG